MTATARYRVHNMGMALAGELLWKAAPVVLLGPHTDQELHGALARSAREPVALIVPADAEWIEAAVQSSVIALFAEPLDDTELVDAARVLTAGSMYVSPSLANPLFLAWRECSYRSRVTQLLTDREREVLDLLSQGCSNRQIAHLLFLSPHTVRNHLSRIFAKLDVGNREEATRVWLRVNRRDKAHTMTQSD